jgi:pimeloyl-ACP methyl ester carboxylesterase
MRYNQSPCPDAKEGRSVPHIRTSEGSLYITDHRRADNPALPVVLVHGAGGSRLDWPPLLRRLPQANAIAIDLPGHGKSPGPGRKTVSDYARCVAALLDALDIPQAIIAGHSMGGAIAQMMALDHAERVHGLVLIGTGAKLRVHPDILDRVLTDPQAVAALLKDWIWGPGTPESMRQLAYDQLMQTPPEIIHGDYLACDAFDVRERLEEIRAPALVIGGTADAMTPHKFSAFLRDHLPNADLVTVEGGGHMMALEHPAFVTDAIRTWLEGNL